MNKKFLLTLGALLASQQVLAATTTTTFDVSAMVGNTCTVSATDLNFRSYDPAVNLTGNNVITINCTSGVAVDIGLDNGLNYASGSRRMTDGSSDYLTYAMYQQSALITPWGNTVGTNTFATTGTGANQPINAWGEVPSGQTGLPAGTYTDTITVTVTY